MRRIAPRASFVLLVCSATLGCHNGAVRAVYRDGDGGVIGIPENTNRWPHYYREQATRAMARHFSQDGYLVVREVEVPKGSTTTFEGMSREADVSPLVSLLRVGKLNGSQNRGEQQSRQLLETHIFYVKNDPKTRLLSGGFSPSPTYTPDAYDGPIAPRLLAQIESKLPKDQATQLAGYTTTKARKDAPSKESAGAEISMPRPIAMPKLEMSQ